MKAKCSKTALCAAVLCFLTTGRVLAADPSSRSPGNKDVFIEFTQNQVEVLRAGAKTWDAGSTNAPHNSLHPGDELRTGENSRVGLRLPRHQATLILDSNSRFLIPRQPEDKSAFEILKGRLFNFHRGPVDEQRFKTPTVSAIVRGTDFNVQVDADGTTTVTMLAGEVRMENSAGAVTLTSGQEGIAKTGEAPRKTAGIMTMNVIQWCLYYPGILDINDLQLSDQDRLRLKDSLSFYAEGDVLHALASLPPEWASGSGAQRLYAAAVLLSAGSVDAARATLIPLERSDVQAGEDVRVAKLARALDQTIATVKLERAPLIPAFSPLRGQGVNELLATELLAGSYQAQAEGQLERSLALAREAATKDPQFSFAWVRIAELEFGFGRLKQAKSAALRARQLAPRNAQTVALEGFLLSAENRINDAIERFNQAIALDPKLANGWLGRGLCRFRKGQTAPALDDLQMAATVEPQRAGLRSYLAKAWSETRANDKALGEIIIAENLDPNDPTGWLYAGLIHHRQNELNQAIKDLEQSKKLNDNRTLFRSKLLLDEDRAVRGANLAALYRDAGMSDVSLREGTRAVDYDYANYSAHLFLAESYDSLRDPRQINLRYETPWLNELLLANLLAPVGAGSLSQNISQQEYSRLLQKDGLGVSSRTEYASRGDWREAGSLFGTFSHTSFSFDSYYAALHGDRPNDDVNQRAFYGKVKQQLTPQDSVFLQVIQYENTSGDVRQYYDPALASTTLRFKEIQDPNIYVGLHHEWGPGNHTLFLGARLQDRVKLTDPNAAFPAFSTDANGTPTFGAFISGFGQTYESELTAYSTELQHIWQQGSHTVVAGGRVQTGEVTAKSRASFDPQSFPPQFFGVTNPAASFSFQSAEADLTRYNAYAYLFWDLIAPLQLSGGVSYDYLAVPNNLDLPPVTAGERRRDQLSPKAGLRWNIADESHLRATYTRSLGGTYYDASVRLEPSQFAGFNQVFRSAIPESVAGQVSGSRFETWGIGLDHKFTRTTFFGVALEALNAKADRLRGAFNYFPPAQPAQYREALEYAEKSLVADINQLIGSDVVIGARYHLLYADLNDRFPDLPSNLPNDGSFLRSQHVKGLLHELDLNALWNHRSGLFAGLQAAYYAQHSSGYTAPVPDSSFWQINGAMGYRFLQRRAEIRLALLNLTDQDYRLNPLTLHPDLPRRRTFVAGLGFVF